MIVIIALLVGITSLAYNGTTKQAREVAMQAELRQAHIEMELALLENDQLTPNMEFTNTNNGVISLTINPNNSQQYCLSITPKAPTI